MRPLLFLDFDDVICLNTCYGAYDVIAPNPPADLYAQLFHPPAVAALLGIVDAHRPSVVITTSWLRFLDRQGIEQVLCRTGLQPVVDALHRHWEAPQNSGMTRFDAIELWLQAHHQREPFVVLDDERSGAGLAESSFDKAGRVVLCEVNVGLHQGHLPAVHLALTQSSVGADADLSHAPGSR